MRLIFIDIETTNESLTFDRETCEIIEIGAYEKETWREFSTFCAINHPLNHFTTELTWITTEDLKNAPSVQIALENFKKFIGDFSDCVLVGHNVEGFDLPVLVRYDDAFKSIKYLDTLQCFQFLYPCQKEYNVDYLFKHFFERSDYQEQHRALQDSKDESDLFFSFLNIDKVTKYRNQVKRWQHNVLDFMSILRQCNGWAKTIQKATIELDKRNWKKDQKSDRNLIENNYLFEWIEKEFIDTKIDVSKYELWTTKIKRKELFEDFLVQYTKKKDKWDWSYDIEKIEIDEIKGIYQNILQGKGKENIPEQREFIKDMTQILNEETEKIAGIEAWTWVWKTFWYLIPAFLFLKKNPSHKVFVSTYTKILEKQILDKDVPIIAEYFKKVKYCQLKASSDAFDLNRMKLKWLSIYEIIVWFYILWEHYYFSDLHYGIQKKLQYKEHEILYNSFIKDCYNTSFWFKGKQIKDLQEKQLFIVNHSFLLSHLGDFYADQITWFPREKDWWASILKEMDYHLIIDEWHNIESVLREEFTYEYSFKQFEKIIKFFDPTEKTNFFSFLSDEKKTIVDAFFQTNELEEQINTICKNQSVNKKEFVKKVIWSLLPADQLSEKLASLSETEENPEKIATCIRECLNDCLLSDNFLTELENFLDKKPFDVLKKNIQDSNLYIQNLKEIKRIRENYEVNEILLEKSEVIKNYLWSNTNEFYKIITELLKIVSDIRERCKGVFNIFQQHADIATPKIIDELINIGSYLRTWKEYLESFDNRKFYVANNEFFVEWFIEFKDKQDDIVDFWLKFIPKTFHGFNNFLENSQNTAIISASLYFPEYPNESYVMSEIVNGGTWWRFPVIKTPFNLKEQRKIFVSQKNPLSDFDVKIQDVDKIIEKWHGKTLILSPNNRDKDRIAEYLYRYYNKECLILKHESWSVNARTNQNMIKMMKNNPHTILIGSKSFMEWVDVPGENLSCVVLRRLPFLPPDPFMNFQGCKYQKLWRNMVQKYFIWNVFKQAIGRLIRSKTDTGEIYILDSKLIDFAWEFLQVYLEWEELYKI